MIRPICAVCLGLALTSTAVAESEPVLQKEGVASYYGDEFQGRKTATGERFRQDKMTAASRDLPLGTRARVTNEENGRSVEVRINDRGPYVDGRIVDLSKKAAKKLGMTRDGLAPVVVEARPSKQKTEELKEAVRERAEAEVEEASAAD